MIQVKHVSFSYSPDIKVLSGISFSIKKGEFIALLGANGAGKSTLLKLLLHKIKPQSGSININSEPVDKKTDWSDIGYVPQKVNIDMNHPATVNELIIDQSLCSHLNIQHLLKKQFKSLSGGQQQRVLVALALQNNPNILLLDEPTVGVDIDTRKKFYSLLKHISAEHSKTIILVTHDNELVEKYASRMLCIDDQHHFSHARCTHD